MQSTPKTPTSMRAYIERDSDLTQEEAESRLIELVIRLLFDERERVDKQLLTDSDRQPTIKEIDQ